MHLTPPMTQHTASIHNTTLTLNILSYNYKSQEKVEQNKQLLSTTHQMGNCTSSCFVVNSGCKAKLIDGNGNLRKVKVPIKAAEIMLEETGHFISPVDDLKKSQRISALRADDELLAGKVYLLVPVSRVNGKVTREEIAMIETSCDEKKSLKRNRKRSGSKVLPAVIDQKVEQEKAKEDDHGMVLGEKDTGFAGYRFGKHKQWIPVLEAISEVY